MAVASPLPGTPRGFWSEVAPNTPVGMPSQELRSYQRRWVQRGRLSRQDAASKIQKALRQHTIRRNRYGFQSGVSIVGEGARAGDDVLNTSASRRSVGFESSLQRSIERDEL